jgi:enoyl-CoA hydratase
MSLVLEAREGAVAVISLNRPEVRNAMNMEMRSGLAAAFAAAEADPEVRCVLLRGEGKHFGAGADINELGRRGALDSAWAPDRLDMQVERMSKPVVASLHGYTLGGLCELSLACTLRIAADDLRIGLPEVNLGVFPALGATQRLPRIVGQGWALHLILTGEMIDAQQALSIGMVTRVVPAAELDIAAMKLAQNLAAKAPVALRAASECVRFSFDHALAVGVELERRDFGLVCGTQDKNEGTAAFLEKRKPQFTGR